MKTQKTFFFAILFMAAITTASVSIQAAFAEPLRQKDYSIQDNGDGTETQILGLPEYVWNGSAWVDRITQNNGTHFNVYSAQGSFSFNKSTCTITQYAQGFNPTNTTAHGSDIIIKDWFWTIARKNGANPWSVIDASIFDCSITTKTNSTGKYLDAKRTDLSSGSYLKVSIAAGNGKPLEDFTTLFMNKTAWSGNKFAFVLWAKDVKADSIKYRNGTTLQIPDGVTMIDRSQLTVQSLDFIKNGNAFFFDWQKAEPYLKTILINRTAGITAVQFGFNNNAATLSTGGIISLDPTYGYTAATSYRVNTITGAGAACPAASIKDTTYNFFTFRYDSTDAGGICGITAPRWNISTIPVGRTILNATIRYDVDTVLNMGGISCDWKPMQFDPSTASAQTVYNDATNGTAFTTETLCRTAGADKVISLHASGNSDIQTKRASQSWWSAGVSYTSMVRVAGTTSSARDTTPGHSIELQVTYSAGAPDAITDLAETTSTTTTVGLGFSAPNLNGGTLQRYVFNYTTPCTSSSPTTVLPNGTTDTSYTVSGLVASTCYSFRASAATEGGFNATGNILNVTTLAFNAANYTIGSFNFNANNPVIFPIRYERIDNGSQTLVNVTFTNTFSLACDLRYTYAGTNHTYHAISSVPVSSSENEASFQFTNSSNDITTFHCWNELGNQSANYVMTQTDFLLKQQVRDFRNGTYGTMGQFGAFDLVTLIVVIISLIGLNRNTEAVAGIFCIMAITVLAYFEIVSWITAIVSAAAVIMLFIVAGTKKT